MSSGRTGPFTGKTRRVATALAAITLAFGAVALANRVGVVITGTITAITGIDAVTVDARTYRIKSGSAAAAEIRKLAKGQLVDLTLDGPPNSSAAAVINIVRHSGS